MTTVDRIYDHVYKLTTSFTALKSINWISMNDNNDNLKTKYSAENIINI